MKWRSWHLVENKQSRSEGEQSTSGILLNAKDIRQEAGMLLKIKQIFQFSPFIPAIAGM